MSVFDIFRPKPIVLDVEERVYSAAKYRHDDEVITWRPLIIGHQVPYVFNSMYYTEADPIVRHWFTVMCPYCGIWWAAASGKPTTCKKCGLIIEIEPHYEDTPEDYFHNV